MKKSLTIWVLFFVAFGSSAQSFVSAEINYGSYSMTRMKQFQQDLINRTHQSGLPLFAVSSFPAYVGYSLSGGVTRNKIAVGFSLGYNSTGGRLDYEDYSGFLIADQLMRSFSFASFFQYKLNSNDKWSLLGSISAGYVYTKFDENEASSLGGQTTITKNGAHSTNYLIRPGLVLRLPMGRCFLDFGLAYEFQILGNLYDNDNPKAYLVTSTGQRVYAQWDGIRLSSAFGFLLKRQK